MDNSLFNCQFRSFIWDTDSHLKSPEEQKLVRKLDFALLTVGCVGFFVKDSHGISCTIWTLIKLHYAVEYLDQNNLTNAYVRCVYAP